MPPAACSLLYKRPELYEEMYPADHGKNPAFCAAVFGRFATQQVDSVVDMGCGTGRDLRGLHEWCPDCVGVDLLPQMIALARRWAPSIRFRVGDMRTVRLLRTFDAVVCMGSALIYLHLNSDIEAAVATFAAHCHRDSVLVLDMHNASHYLGAPVRPPREVVLESGSIRGRYTTSEAIDRARQTLIRRRSWVLDSGDVYEDVFQYRLLFPRELEAMLSAGGFSVCGMYDNRAMRESDLSGSILYVVARYVGNRPRPNPSGEQPMTVT